MNLLTKTNDLVPSLNETLRAAQDTRLLLKMRWRFARNRFSRLFVFLGLTAFLFALFIASQIGSLIRVYSEQGVGTAAGQFAVNYVIALNRGELGLIGATAVGSVIIIALFTPFTGSSMLALAPTDDLAGLRPNRTHRYFDSLITNAVSAIGFLQLITLTGIGSLLTLDGGRPAGLLFMWSIWPVVTTLTVAEGWAIEIAQRRYGRRARRITAAVMASIVGVAVLLDPQHGRTLFGLGNQISATVAAAANGQDGIVFRNLCIVMVLVAVLFVTGISLCRTALSLPAPVNQTRSERRRLIPMSARPNLALIQILIAQVTRSAEIRRPLLTIFFIGIPAVWFSGNTDTMTTMVVAVPLAVALAFGINTFGILGPAMPWLAAQPRLMNRLLLFAIGIQLTMTLTLSVLVWTPATLFGRVSTADLASVAAGTFVSSYMTARSATHKSVNRPFRVRLGTRGDMIVPPLTAINYTMRFALWSGQIGVLVMTRDDRYMQLSLVAIAVIWTTFRFWQLLKQWQDRDVQAFVTKQVAAA